MLYNTSFEIRDLVNSLHPTSKYLLLVQSANKFKIYTGTPDHLMPVKLNTPNNVVAYDNDIAEKVEYFSDVSDRREILMDKFIHHIDHELGEILNSYKLPVFVAGTTRMNGHFKKFTRHEKSILDYLHGNYDDASEYHLLDLIKPYLIEMERIETANISRQIEDAQNRNTFCCGIADVWHNAYEKKGKLLIVENGYHYPATDIKKDKTDNMPHFLNDGVDIIIEMVLENGGAVKFADAALMTGYQHIGLCMYY